MSMPCGKLVKIGTKLMHHGCYIIFQMAEVAVPKDLAEDIRRLIGGLQARANPA